MITRHHEYLLQCRIAYEGPRFSLYILYCKSYNFPNRYCVFILVFPGNNFYSIVHFRRIRLVHINSLVSMKHTNDDFMSLVGWSLDHTYKPFFCKMKRLRKCQGPHISQCDVHVSTDSVLSGRHGPTYSLSLRTRSTLGQAAISQVFSPTTTTTSEPAG